ncbi:hypothetical protein VPH35_077715 [Triticum aestivum]
MLMLLVSPVFPLVFLGWSLLFFRVQQLMVICPKQKLVSKVAYLIEQKCQKQIPLMFMCYVLCFAAADLFLWRNKISAGVLAGATAIWLLFEEKEHTQEKKEQAQEKKSEQEKKALDCCCWSVEDLGSVTALHRLPPADVARAACACRLLSTVASDRAVLEAAFRAPWGVHHVLSDPATRALWRAASLARFALSRALRRGVTAPGIALSILSKYHLSNPSSLSEAQLGVQEL